MRFQQFILVRLIWDTLYFLFRQILFIKVHIFVIVGLKKLHDSIRHDAESWFSRMDPGLKTDILGHYGDMPSLEHEYWRLANGPAWCWWLLAIMPLDHLAQVNNLPVILPFSIVARV